MIEIAKVYFVVNAQQAGQHFLTQQQDEELVNVLIADISGFIADRPIYNIKIGHVTYSRGCLEVCVPLLIDLVKDCAHVVWSSIEVMATVGGAYAFIKEITQAYNGKYIKRPNSDFEHSIYLKKIEEFSEEEILAELTRRKDCNSKAANNPNEYK